MDEDINDISVYTNYIYYHILFIYIKQIGVDNMDILRVIVEKFKLKDIIAIILIVSFSITVMPDYLIIKLGLYDFTNKFRMYISLCLIISISYFVIILMGKLMTFVSSRIVNYKKIGIKYMKKDMSPDEMQLLVQTFYNKEENEFNSSGYIDISDGRKAALVNKHIIYLSAQVSYFDSFAYNLQPYALKFLNKNLNNGNIKFERNRFQYILE